MSVDLREVVIGGDWEVHSASLGGSTIISTHSIRAEAVQAAINYKMANTTDWVTVLNSRQTFVVVDSV